MERDERRRRQRRDERSSEAHRRFLTSLFLWLIWVLILNYFFVSKTNYEIKMYVLI